MPSFGHVVLRTNRVDEMCAWYCRVLTARVVARTDRAAFLAYDDAHHRLALVDVGALASPRTDVPGLAHVAFRFDSLAELLDAFAALRAASVEPARAVNHRLTASIYYQDPDGNEVELFVDTGEATHLADVVSGTQRSWDPVDILDRYRDGASERELAERLR